MSSSEQATWSHPAELDVHEMLRVLDHFTVPQFVDVVLVGFNGDGNGGLTLPIEAVNAHLKALRKDHHALAALLPPPSGNHSLPVRLDFVFSASHAPPPLARAVNALVHDTVVRFAGTLVDSAPLTRLLEEHAAAALSGATLTLFLLNPRLPAPATRGAAQSALYWYLPGGSDTAENPATTGQCGATVGVSRARNLAWVDLSAGPAEYGPATSGVGGLSLGALPSIRRAVQRAAQRFGVAEAHTGRAAAFADALPARLAALASRSAESLLSPTLWRLLPGFTPSLSVRITVFTANDGADTHARLKADWEAVLAEAAASSVPGQTVLGSVAVRPLRGCAACVAALASAARARTSVHPAGSRLLAHPHEALDPTALRDGMAAYAPTAGDHPWAAGRAVRVFVFDTAPDARPVLFTGRRVTAAFPGVVLALQSPGHRVPLDVKCNGNTRVLHTADARREVLVSLAGDLWGLPPTRTKWDRVTGRVEDDWLWEGAGHLLSALAPGDLAAHDAPPAAVDPVDGNTRSRLPAFARAAAGRNVVLSHALHHMDALAMELAEVAEHGLALGDLLLADERTAAAQRWNRVAFHVDRIASALALGDAREALYHARAMEADAKALRETTRRAVNRIAAHYDCLHDSARSGVHVAELLAMVAGGAFAIWLGRLAVLRLYPEKTLKQE